MIELILVKQPVRILPFCRLKIELVCRSLGNAVEFVRAEGESHADFVASHYLVSAIVIIGVWGIIGCILESVLVVHDERDLAVDVLKDSERLHLKHVLDQVFFVCAKELVSVASNVVGREIHDLLEVGPLNANAGFGNAESVRLTLRQKIDLHDAVLVELDVHLQNGRVRCVSALHELTVENGVVFDEHRASQRIRQCRGFGTFLLMSTLRSFAHHA
jgi:hypothetical protein